MVARTYTGLQIVDPWTVSPDFTRHLTSWNKTQATRNPDGTYTYVISIRDPGVGKLGGHAAFTMLVSFSLAGRTCWRSRRSASSEISNW